MNLVRADDLPPQRWRNGGGFTRELLAWPAGDAWRLRLSLADIEQDGPFSAFPGVERWFVVVSGAGVGLRFADGERLVAPGDAPIRFDGALAPHCRLQAGPTRDLNLMLRRVAGTLSPACAGEAAPGDDTPFQAFFSATAGTWEAGDGTARPLDALSLLWPAGGGRFRPAPSGAACGWWIGCAEAVA